MFAGGGLLVVVGRAVVHLVLKTVDFNIMHHFRIYFVRGKYEMDLLTVPKDPSFIITTKLYFCTELLKELYGPLKLKLTRGVTMFFWKLRHH